MNLEPSTFRQIQAVLIFVRAAFPGDLEIVFAAIRVIIDIVFDAGVLGFHRNLPDGFLDGQLQPAPHFMPEVIDRMDTGNIGIRKIVIPVGGVAW